MLDKITPAPRRLTALDRRLTYRLSRLQARLNRHATIVLTAQSDLTLTQWRLLTSISALESTTLAELVREMQYDKAQLSRGITALEQMGLIALTPDPNDQRRQLLSLTEAGRVEHERMLPVVRGRQKMLTADMTETEVEQLFALLDKLDTALDGQGV